MVSELQIGGVTVDVLRKDIKNIHLSVHPPTGRVRIAAPSRIALDTIRVFAISKLSWIKQNQQKMRNQSREAPREYITRESHYLWGQRYLLKIVENNQIPTIETTHKYMVLHTRPNTSAPKRQVIMETWYREQLKQALPSILSKWEPLIGVHTKRIFVQRMKTKWGSCNPQTGSIRLNSELAKSRKNV